MGQLVFQMEIISGNKKIKTTDMTIQAVGTLQVIYIDFIIFFKQERMQRNIDGSPKANNVMPLSTIENNFEKASSPL
jgi:hypothetical protein